MHTYVKGSDSWPAVSSGLLARGIDPERVIFAENFPDSSVEYYLIVTHKKEIIEFYYDWPEGGYETQGKIIRYRDCTNNIKDAFGGDTAQFVLDHFEELVAKLLKN